MNLWGNRVQNVFKKTIDTSKQTYHCITNTFESIVHTGSNAFQISHKSTVKYAVILKSIAILYCNTVMRHTASVSPFNGV